MSKNATNRNVNGKECVQAVPVHFALFAMAIRIRRGFEAASCPGGRLDNLSLARAEAQLRIGRWSV